MDKNSTDQELEDVTTKPGKSVPQRSKPKPAATPAKASNVGAKPQPAEDASKPESEPVKAPILADNTHPPLIVAGLFYRQDNSRNLVAPPVVQPPPAGTKNLPFHDVEIVVNDSGKLFGISRFLQEGWPIHPKGSELSKKLLNLNSGLRRSVVAFYGSLNAGKSFVIGGLMPPKTTSKTAVPHTKGFGFIEPFADSSFLLLVVLALSSPCPNTAEAHNNSLCTDLLIRAVSYQTADTFIYITAALTSHDQKVIHQLHQKQVRDSKNASIIVVHNCKDIHEMKDFQSYMLMVQGAYAGSWFETKGTMLKEQTIATVLDDYFGGHFLSPTHPIIYLRQPYYPQSGDTPTITHFFLTNDGMNPNWNNATFIALRDTATACLKRPPPVHPLAKMIEAIQDHLGDFVQLDCTKPTPLAAGGPVGAGYLLCVDPKTRVGSWTLSTMLDETSPRRTVFLPSYAMTSHEDFIQLQLEVPGCSIDDIHVRGCNNHTIEIKITKKKLESRPLIRGVLDLPPTVDGIFTTQIDFSCPPLQGASPNELTMTLNKGILTLRFPKHKERVFKCEES